MKTTKPILHTLSALALSGAILAGCNRGDNQDQETREGSPPTTEEEGTGVGSEGTGTGGTGAPGTSDTGLGTLDSDTAPGTGIPGSPGTGGTRLDTGRMSTDTLTPGTGAFDTSRAGGAGGSRGTEQDTASLDTMGSGLPGTGGSGTGGGM